MKRFKDNLFINVLLESGHYSNGQSGCSLSNEFKDGTDDCKNIKTSKNTDFSQIINRTNGEFSTNFSKVIINFRKYHFKNESENIPNRMYSLNLGFQYLHNGLFMIPEEFFKTFGGFSERDGEFYIKKRILIDFEFMNTFNFVNFNHPHINLKINFEYGYTNYSKINPLRLQLTSTMFLKKLGLFISYIYGHDNYNLRFVDNVKQFILGITWESFPLVIMR